MAQPPPHSCIVTATERNDFEMLKRGLILYPLKVDASFQGRSALHEASRRGNLKMIQHLITNYADINICDNDDQTPLHYSVLGDSPEAVDLLLKLGARMSEEDKRGYTAPQVAFQEKRNECVAVFLKKDKNVLLLPPKQSLETQDIQQTQTLNPEVAEHSNEQESEDQKCISCQQEPGLFTIEPCGCRTCIECSTRNVACKCGKAIDKVSFELSPEIQKYVEDIKKLKQKIVELEQDKICTICTANPLDCALQCGHLFCKRCVRKQSAGQNQGGLEVWKCSYGCKPSRYLKIFP